MKKKKEKRNMALLLCETIDNVSVIFLDTFLVAYFFQLTNQNLTIISNYYIIAYIIVGLFFWLSGDIIKTKNKVKVYQYGIILKCIFILFVAILGPRCKEYYIVLGILYGITQGLYWVPCHALRTEIQDKKSTKNYLTTQTILNQGVKIAFPIMIGTSIQLTSFSKVGTIIFIITLVQLIISHFIKIENRENNNFNLLKYIKKVKELGEFSEGIKRSYRSAFLSAINNTLLNKLITIMIMMTFASAFDLGILTTIFSICTMISVFIFKRYYQAKYSKKYIIICTIIPVISVLGLVFDFNKSSVIIYNLCNAIFIVIISAMESTQRFNCVKIEEIEHEYKIEHQAIYEIYLAFGRVISFLVLGIVGLLNNLIYFKLLLILITIAIIINSFNLYKIENVKRTS